MEWWKNHGTRWFSKWHRTNAESIAESLTNDTEDTHRRLIIEVDNVSSGEMNYRNLGNGVAEIGIKICDFSKQEKGYGKVLISMLINSLFDDFGYQKIILDTNLNNKRAQHVYKQLGFHELRVNHDSWLNQVGELQSSIDYEMAKDDFNNYAL